MGKLLKVLKVERVVGINYSVVLKGIYGTKFGELFGIVGNTEGTRRWTMKGRESKEKYNFKQTLFLLKKCKVSARMTLERVLVNHCTINWQCVSYLTPPYPTIL
jgi:hypothetical protein